MYVTATGDSRWSSTEISSLRKIMPSDFRVVLTQPRYTWHTKVWPNSFFVGHICWPRPWA